MQITGYNGVLFSTLNVAARINGDTSPGPNRNQQEQPRLGGDPLIPQIVTGGRPLTILFTAKQGFTLESVLQGLLARLAIDDPAPAKLLTGVTVSAVAVEALAHCLTWRQESVNQLAVDFVVANAGWRASASTSILAATVKTGDGTISIAAQTGGRDVYPTLQAYYLGTAQRAGSAGASNFGLRFRYGPGITLTNTGTEPLRNQPYQIGPVDTKTAIAASRMLASGGDLRVFADGRELRRNVIGINRKGTFIWVILPDLEPGQSTLLEVCYGNTNNTNPPTLTFTSSPPLPAMDISGDSLAVTSSTVTTSTVAGTPWEINQWYGATVILESAAGNISQIRTCQGNTANTISVGTNWSTAPVAGDILTILKSGLHGIGGTATAGAANSITDSSSVLNASYVGGWVDTLTGTGASQSRQITSIVGTQINISPAWTINPAAGTTYRVRKNNTKRQWDVRGIKKTTPHKGLWGANKSDNPPTSINFDAPGSWYRFTMLRNDDSYSQPRYTSYLIGGSDFDHFPLVNIRRSRKGKAGQQTEVGLADSVGYFSPFPIRYFEGGGLNFRNAKKAGSGTPGEGMCEARMSVQETGSELWSTVASDVAVYSSLLTGGLVGTPDLTQYGSPNRIAYSLLPNGGDEINENDNNTAQLIAPSTGTVWTAYVDTVGILTESADWWGAATAVPGEVSVYDIWLRYTNKGASPTRPYNQLEVGGTDRRVFVSNSDERVEVNCETHRARIVTSAGVLVRDIQYAVQAFEVVDDINGTAYTRVDGRWLPVPVYPGDTSRDIAFSDPSGSPWGSLTLSVTGRLGYLT